MRSTALIVIDVQKGFLDPIWGNRSQPDFEENTAALLSHWRCRSLPIIHIQHLSREIGSPLRPDQPGSEFMPVAQPLPGEPVLTKSVHSAFIGTDLERYLREREISDVVIAGLTVDHCVSTTVRMAHDLGFRVKVPIDGVATFERRGQDGTLYPAELVHQLSLASLDGEFAEVQSLSDIIAGR
ncbi:MAG: cysteine hydrolase [Bdellovibrionaceae bacterium]|nr:cysteine hydrolase [Pseudobdellovibrionaceae bacterium]